MVMVEPYPKTWLQPRYFFGKAEADLGMLSMFIGVGTAGQRVRSALAPAMIKPRGRKYLFAPSLNNLPSLSAG